jgi:hypothetical protein
VQIAGASASGTVVLVEAEISGAETVKVLGVCAAEVCL